MCLVLQYFVRVETKKHSTRTRIRGIQQLVCLYKFFATPVTSDTFKGMKASIKSFPTYNNVKFRAVTSSTLLIPMKMLEYFNTRERYFKSRGRYFEYLIMTYGRQLHKFGLNPTVMKWKKEYQKTGLDLQVRNFKPDPEFWEEFRHIGLAYGVGMCLLFVILLELEYKLWLEAGSPEKFHESRAFNWETNYFDVNSRPKLSTEDKKDIINLLSSSEYTVLIRSMDFSKHKLHRICLIA